MKKPNILNIFKFGLFFLATTPLIPNRIKGLPVIILLVSSFLLFLKTKNKLFNWKLFIVNSSLFLVYLLSFLYTSNIADAIKKLETSLSLMVFPLAFALVWEYREQFNFKVLLKKIISIFFYSVFVFTIIVFSYLIYKGGLLELKDSSFIRHFTEFLPFIGQHSIYASIYLGLGVISSIYLLIRSNNLIQKTVIVLINFFSILLLVSLASKGVLLALTVSVTVYCINVFKLKLIVLISIFGFIVLSINYSPSLSKRIKLFNSSLALPLIKGNGDLNSTQTRIEIYKCSLKLLRDKWVFGYGFGDVNEQLIECFTDTSKYLVEGKFNSHNQYLSIVLGCGIFGLLSIFSLIYFNYKFFNLDKNYFFIAVLLFYSTIMLIENILERQSGVILFSFLINLFSYISFKKNLNYTLQKL